jgi:hypothetical protein
MVMEAWTDPHYRMLSQIIRRVAAQPLIRQRLQDDKTRTETMKELGIPSEDALADVLNLLDLIEEKAGPQSTPTTSPIPAHLTPHTSTEQVNSAQQFFEQAFHELQRAHHISLGMSVAIFVIGIIFLILAALQTIIDPSRATTTAIVGGIGIIQIVALFYRNPLADIARSVSNAQQAKITLTSYLIGVSLIRDNIGLSPPQESHLEHLSTLTEKTLTQLQTYVEEPSRSETAAGQ